ncbi:ABC transporter permease [bacterium]|nr:ABC transporter permease [bacterium]
MILSYTWKQFRRNPARSWIVAISLALAVGLFSSIVYFVDASSRSMTQSVIAPVRLDMVANVIDPQADPIAMSAALAGKTGIATAQPVQSIDFSSLSKVGGSKALASPAGRLFAVNADYFKKVSLVGFASGGFSPAGAVISEASSISRGIKVGDLIEISFPSAARVWLLPVTGIADMSNAAPLFSTGKEAENAVVADVVFVDLAKFHSMGFGSPVASSIHILLDRSLFPPDPARTAVRVATLGRSIERAFPGALKVQDELSAVLKTAQADSLSAKILFIFLGFPGVVLAAYLASFSSRPFAAGRKRELGLLRTRGAGFSTILGITALNSLFLAIAASIMGIAFSLLLLTATSLQGAHSASPFAGGFNWAGFAGSTFAAFFVGFLSAFFSDFLPAITTGRKDLYSERRGSLRKQARPFYERYFLDVIMLLFSGIVLFITMVNGGFKPTGNEGSAVSLSLYVFLAPLFAWIGFTFLSLRLTSLFLRRRPELIARTFGRLYGEIGSQAGRSLSRRVASIASAAAVIGLTISFGLSLTIFQASYLKEKAMEARYVVGSDIRFTPSLMTPQNSAFADSLRIPGTESATAVTRDVNALIGTEKNTVYGIDVATFSSTAYLPDSFFVDPKSPKTIDALNNGKTGFAPGTAKATLDALASTPDGVIISVEQAQKYGILPGDSVKIRLFKKASNSYVDVVARAVGFFTFFPTSSQDSDFIVNRDFMTGNLGSDTMAYYLVKTKPGAMYAVSEKLAATYKPRFPVNVVNADTALKIDESSLTSMSLSNLGLMETIFIIIIASFGIGIFMVSIMNERKREFGVMRALGATSKQTAVFLSVEAVTITALSVIIGFLVGFPLSKLLVMLLGIIFTIPVHAISFPLASTSVLILSIVAGSVLGSRIVSRSIRQLKVVTVLREE